jgi:hypothetical protein
MAGHCPCSTHSTAGKRRAATGGLKQISHQTFAASDRFARACKAILAWSSLFAPFRRSVCRRWQSNRPDRYPIDHKMLWLFRWHLQIVAIAYCPASAERRGRSNIPLVPVGILQAREPYHNSSRGSQPSFSHSVREMPACRRIRTRSSRPMSP